MLRLLAEHPGSTVSWVVFSDDPRDTEARTSANDFLEGAGDSRVPVHQFRESFFPSLRAEVKDAFEALKNCTSPDVVFTHRRDDEHQDDHTIGQLTWNTFRD